MQKELIDRFEKGDLNAFFSTWKKAFPVTDEAIDILEFYLRVYFATFPLRKTPPVFSDYGC